jgi:hypothetical protein
VRAQADLRYNEMMANMASTRTYGLLLAGALLTLSAVFLAPSRAEAAQCGSIMQLNCCGNATLDAGETCDGSKFKGDNACTAYNPERYSGGTLTCSSDCTGVVETSCTAKTVLYCGNGKLDPEEVCDGTLFRGPASCTQLDVAKYASGALTCAANCKSVSESACVPKSSGGSSPNPANLTMGDITVANGTMTVTLLAETPAALTANNYQIFVSYAAAGTPPEGTKIGSTQVTAVAQATLTATFQSVAPNAAYTISMSFSGSGSVVGYFTKDVSVNASGSGASAGAGGGTTTPGNTTPGAVNQYPDPLKIDDVLGASNPLDARGNVGREGLSSLIRGITTGKGLVGVLLAFGLSFLGVVALLMLVIAGFRYITAYDGDTGGPKKAIAAVVIGIVVVSGAWALVTTLINFGAGPPI